MSDWIYDIETYPNCFTFCTVFHNGKGIRVFECSDRKDDTELILSFLRNVIKHKHRLVGFNCNNFDMQIMQKIIDEASYYKKVNKKYIIDPVKVYDWVKELIGNQKDERFSGFYRESEFSIPNVDLFKVHHFDNKARSTSLKLLEFNMRSDNIEDLPFPVGISLTDEQKDVLIEYNKHDVLQTLQFYNHSKEAIEFRASLSEKYGFDCTNYNDTKIGKEYFIRKIEEVSPGRCYKILPNGSRKINQTKREYIDIKDCLFDYLEFSNPAFQAVHKWFLDQRITETKGVFTDIEEHLLGDVAKYANMKTKRIKLSDPLDRNNKRYIPNDECIADLKKEHPCGWLEEQELKSPKGAKSYYWNYRVAESFNVVVDGLEFVFGTGGIHASVESTSIKPKDGEMIIDADVSSMYPNIAIANRVYPKHLGVKFCDIYEDVYNARKSYPKGSPENAAMKLALNGVYGDSNNQSSPFYDPQYTMTITINGQLSLCMLAESLMKVSGLTIIQCNTDGVTVVLPKEKKDQYDLICNEWMTQTKLQLEFAEYKAMYIRDVNNYIAEYIDGKVKRKGAYEYDNLGWHQNQSALIIPQAAEHQLLGRGNVNEYIKSHTNKWDFMLRTKVPRDSRLVLEYEDGKVIPQQNICRYYISKNGGKLIKIMPPVKGKEEDRRLSIDKDWNVKTCNDISKFDWEIDYDYYISEAKKLVDPLL